MFRKFINCSTKTINILRSQSRYMTVPTYRIVQPFSMKNINNATKSKKDQNIEQLKKESKEFYNNHVQKITQLKSSADFQPIIINTKEPIILDLYADWCEPCKKLTPRLQSKVNSLQNVKLVKVNIDKCPQIAHALQVKSVPTVYLLYQGQAIDKIQGNVGDQELNKFFDNINKVTGQSPQRKEAVQVLESAKSLINQQKIPQAVQVLSKFNQKKVSEELIMIKQLLLTQCYLILGKPSKFNDSIARAGKFEQLLKQAPQLQQFYRLLKQEIQKFQQQSKEDPQIQTLKDKIIKSDNKNDKLSAQFDLANLYKNKQMTQNALQVAIQIIKQDKAWEQKKANKFVLNIFKQLGNNSPLVQKYRKILQRVLS